MERKYYLRGLGIGIVMTAIIMGIALSGSRKMTDAEIIKRAKELGMVEDTYLSDTVAGENSEPAEQNIEDNTEELAENSKAEPEPESQQMTEEMSGAEEPVEPEEVLPVAEPVESEPAETAAESAGDETAGAEAGKADGRLSETETKEDTNEMTRQEDSAPSSVKVERVTIVSGDGSYTVALKLKEAGVVMSAESFDDFLCERGYDKKLRTGTFQIPADASDEQIARIVTGQE